MRSLILIAVVAICVSSFSGAEALTDTKHFSFRLPPLSRPKRRTLTAAFKSHVGPVPPFLRDAKLTIRVAHKSKYKLTGSVTIDSPSLGTAVTQGRFVSRSVWGGFVGVMHIYFKNPNIRMRFFLRGSPSGGFIGLGDATHKFRRPSGVRMVRSKTTVAQGVAALKAALEANSAGPRFIKTVDHAAAARNVGLQLAESSVVVFGRPQIGATLWRQTAQIGIELPGEILIAESPLGIVYVAYNSWYAVAKRFKVTIAPNLPNAFANFARIAAGLEMLDAEPAGFDVDRTTFLEGVEEKTGPTTAAAAYARLIAALEKAPPVNIAYAIEHDKSAEKEGITVASENKVAVFGNPTLGTPVMQQSFTAALDLPAKMGVWDLSKGSDTAYVGYVKPTYIAKRHGADPQPTLTGALGNFANVAIGA